MGSVSQQKAFDYLIRPWWSKVLIGVLMIVIGIRVLSDYSAIESGEKPATFASRGTDVLYNIGGKWLAALVPALVGAGMMAWGAWQLSRQTFGAPVSARVPTDNSKNVLATPPSAVVPDGMHSDELEPTTLQALFTSFYQGIGMLLVVGHFCAAVMLGRMFFPDLHGSWYGVVAVVAAIATILEMEFFARAMKWEEGPIFDARIRAHWLIAIGLTVALGLTIYLAITESASADSLRQSEQQAAQDRAERARQLSSPEMKAAQELIRKRQEQQHN